MFGTDPSESEHATRQSPSYSLTDSSTIKALSITAGLFVGTTVLMVLFANTPIAGVISSLYSFEPFVGAAIIGGLLTVGRHLGLSGFESGVTANGLFGVLITMLTYGAFGGSIISGFAPSTYISAIVISTLITLVITLVAGGYVITRDKSFKSWETYSQYAFFGVFLSLGIGIIGGPIFYLIGFGLAILGFTIDLVYEIWVTTSDERTAEANGFAIYIAVTGIFVHILQIVIRALADR